MTIAEVVAELGHKIGLGALALDGEGRCALSFEGGPEVDFQRVGDDLALTTVIGRMPQPANALTLERLLAANLPGSGRSDAALALDPGQGVLVYNLVLAGKDLDLPTLEGALAGFLADRRSLWARIRGGGGTAEEAAPAPAAPPARPDGPSDWMIRA